MKLLKKTLTKYPILPGLLIAAPILAGVFIYYDTKVFGAVEWINPIAIISAALLILLITLTVEYFKARRK